MGEAPAMRFEVRGFEVGSFPLPLRGLHRLPCRCWENKRVRSWSNWSRIGVVEKRKTFPLHATADLVGLGGISGCGFGAGIAMGNRKT